MTVSRIYLVVQLFYIVITLQACAKDSRSPAANPVVAPVTDTGTAMLTYLALGDSYTIGQSVQADERYPAQTVQMLKQNDGILIKQPQYIAVTGWTTIDLQNAIAVENPAGPYDIVTLLIGVNDQFQGLDTGGYRKRFTQLLQKSIALAGNKKAHVFVLSIPDYGVTPFGGGSAMISAQVDIFNSINKAVTLANNVAYVDVTDLSKAMANNPALVADGLHPSGIEYSYWSARLSMAVETVFK